MKNILNFKSYILTICMAFLGVLILTSCEDDEPTNTQTTLLSFGPSGVKHGEDIIFIGTNLDKVDAILFKPAVEITEFKEQSAERITVTVPQDAEPGILLLKTATEEIQTKTILNFEVPVNITNFQVSAKPGETITITGDKLNWVESITFPTDKAVLSEEFESQSASEIVVTIPIDAQSGFMIFRTGGTKPLVFASETELNVLTPQISSLNPMDVRHESTLEIIGLNLDLVTEVVLPDNVVIAKDSFISQSTTSIQLTVPAEVERGFVTLRQVSPVEVQSSDELVIVLPEGNAISPEMQVPGVDEVTISGSNLDLVASIELPGHGTLLSAEFTSQTADEIVFNLPAGAVTGIINYTTIHGYSSSLGLVISVPSSGLDDLLIPCFVDAVAATMGEGGGFGGAVTDFANTENPREGTIAMKVTFDGSFGGGAQLGTWGKPDLSTSGAEVFAFSIYGAAGTDNQKLNLNVKSGSDNVVEVAIKEGEWVDYQLPLSDFGSPTAITEIWFQDQGFSGSVYIDRVGFDLERAMGPTPLTIVAFDDAVAPIFGEGGGWGGSSSEFGNMEQAREGSSSIKATFAGDFGGGAQLGTWGKDNVSLAGVTTFAFSLYGGSGTEGNQLNVNVKLDSDNPQLVTIKEGEWVDIEIPLSTFGSFTEITEIWFQDQGWSGDVYIDHMGFR